MKSVTIYDAKTHLSKLIREVEAGHEVVILRGKVPVAKLVKLESTGRQRRLGTARGEIRIGDDFDDPVPGFEPYQ